MDKRDARDFIILRVFAHKKLPSVKAEGAYVSVLELKLREAEQA